MLDFYYSNRLTSKLSSGLSSVYNAILSLKSQINLFGYSHNEAKTIIETIMKDYPDLYYFNFNLVQYQPSPQGTVIRLTYYDYDLDLFEREVNEITLEIDKRLNNQSTDYDIIKTIYDVIVERVSYDYDAFNRFGEVDQNSHDQLSEYFNNYGHCFNMYGVIVLKKAVCMGMSHAIKYFMNRYRIECAFLECEHFVEGSADTYPHAINVIEYDNQCYYLDASKGKFDNMDMLRYDFFMVNQERVKNYYQINENFECNDDSIEYFEKEKLTFKNVYDLRKYLDGFSYKSTKGLILFKYKGKVKKDYLEKVIEENIGRRCGSMYGIDGFVVIDNYGYCKISKR